MALEGFSSSHSQSPPVTYRADGSLAQRPRFIAAEHHQPAVPGTLKLVNQLFKPQHHIALPKVLHCDGLPLSKPRLNQL